MARGHDDFGIAALLIEHAVYEFGAVIVLGKVGQQQVAHERRLVTHDQLQCLAVGQVTITTTDTLFQEAGIVALVEHLLVIVGFEEGSVAAAEMMHQLFARAADIGEYANGGVFRSDGEAIGIGGIVVFAEGADIEVAKVNGFAVVERAYQFFIEEDAAVAVRAGCDIDREVVFARGDGQPADMVGVFVRNKDGAQVFDRQTETVHPFFDLAAGDARVYQHGVFRTAHIIAIAITPRI